MIKKGLLFIFFLAAMFCAKSQVMATKTIGKYSNQSNLGWGVFVFYDFPLNGTQNQSLRIELMDFAYYSTKNDLVAFVPIAYLSTKLGYKYVFSETKTGFYIEPQAGYCRVVSNNPSDFYPTQVSDAGGVALALEAGYSLEVGQRGHAINFGLKFESDIAGNPNTVNSLGLRVSYQFNMFRKRDEY
jgi:hypothetical protein